MMKIKPILFSTPMVQAIQENRKWQTRRKIKVDENYAIEDGKLWTSNRLWNSEVETSPNPLSTYVIAKDRYGHEFKAKAKFQRGDILWVRESFEIARMNISDTDPSVRVNYKADGGTPFMGWKPSIHMPKAAARIFLEVTNVRVERLRDISEHDAIAEGIKVIQPDEAYYAYDNGVGSYATARGSFLSLWTSINGQASTDANPWVFVYDFKRVERPANF